MNYLNHDLRTNLQEWKSRIARATSQQLGHQVKYIFAKFESNGNIKNLIQDAVKAFPYTDIELEQLESQQTTVDEIDFGDEVQLASYCYQFLKWTIKKYGFSKF